MKFSFEYITNQRTNGANAFQIFEDLPHHNSARLAFALKKMAYENFLRTAYWFSVSMVAKSRAGMRCQVCNCTSGIEAHHRTYDTHGMEHLNMMDIIVLCTNCHGLFHGHKKEAGPQLKLIQNPPKPLTETCVRIRAQHIIEHTEEEIKIPNGDSFVLTIYLINACRANGAFTNATLRAFGASRPMVAGWVGRLIGRRLTRDEYRSELEGRFIYRERLMRRNGDEPEFGKPRLVPDPKFRHQNR